MKTKYCTYEVVVVGVVVVDVFHTVVVEGVSIQEQRTDTMETASFTTLLQAEHWALHEALVKVVAVLGFEVVVVVPEVLATAVLFRMVLLVTVTTGTG